MLGFDRILVPVDFSADSMAAVGYAMALAKKLQGPQTVVVLYVVDEGLPVVLESSSHASQGSKEQERSLKKAAVARLETWLAGVDTGEESIEHAVVVGRPASEEICEFAEETGVDLIVVGTQGKGSLRRLVLGSTVTQVQKYATVPVLAVKDPAAHAVDEP
jgi:nucleotide-binding universal stress UspA family protein